MRRQGKWEYFRAVYARYRRAAEKRKLTGSGGGILPCRVFRRTREGHHKIFKSGKPEANCESVRWDTTSFSPPRVTQYSDSSESSAPPSAFALDSASSRAVR